MKFFTKQWYRLMRNSDKMSQKSIDEYGKCIQKYDVCTMNIVRQLHLHDVRLIDVKWDNDTLYLSFDNTHTQATIQGVIFYRVSLRKDEGIAVGDSWEYEEVLLENGKFHIGVLFETPCGIPRELELIAESVSFVESPEKIEFFARLQDLLSEYKVSNFSGREKVLAHIRECLKNEEENRK